MEKQQIIAFIQNQIEARKISREDLLVIAHGLPESSITIGSTPTTAAAIQENTSKNLINVFYVIGALIVLIGVVILIAQNWDEIGFIGRVGVTLGISLITYITALLFSKTAHNVLSQVMFTLSAVLAPFGTFILLDEMRIDLDSATQVIMSLVFVIIYSVAYFISRKNILVLIVTTFATWAYYAFLFNLFEEDLFNDNLITWATMVLGFSYFAIGYGFAAMNSSDGGERRSVSHVLYASGTLAVLGSGIALGGIWDLIFIALIFATFYVSVFLRSRAMLVLAAGFLVGHIIKLTSKYFLDSIGWPLALILCGFAVIGVGYMTYYVNKKYITR
jgi:uncharacterized membrane protein